MNRTLIAAAVVLGAAFCASPAAAQTTILADDAEGAPDAKWVVGPAPTGVQPWQKSDSATQKFRGNQAHGGATSYWSGVSPQDWPLVPTTAGPGTVIEGESLLTLKEPIIVPADGETILSYWSMFQNEGDDQGIAQLAPISADGTQGAWKNIKTETATATAAGDTDPRACDPSRPDSPVAFEEIKVPLKSYAGFKVMLRFNLKYGAENRPVSHPCGWYLDDIAVRTTGTPDLLAGAAATATEVLPTPAGVAPTVKFRSLKARGKKAKLALAVSGGAIEKVAITLLKGSKKVAVKKAAFLKVGKGTVTFKVRRKLKKGTYTVKLAGLAGNGSSVVATGKVKRR